MLKSINGSGIFYVKIHLTTSLLIISLVALLLNQSCGSAKVHRISNNIETVLEKDSFSHHHSGLLVIDPVSLDTLFSSSSSRYFIPASNVKIATLYAALALIPEKMPSIQYVQKGDTVYFEGLGNPATLHPKLNDSSLIKFLERHHSIFYSPKNMNESVWAPGWAWEDYDLAFSAERNSLPLFGNVVTIIKGEINRVSPKYFKDSISSKKSDIYREESQNIFFPFKTNRDTLTIPYKTSPQLTAELLESYLGRQVRLIDELPGEPARTILYGISRDTILRHMMLESDNFMAEQILLNASAVLSDSLSSSLVIEYMKEELFRQNEQMPRWVDGSGLSRYNLFTPESLVSILHSLYSKYGWEYIQAFFPAGGQSGTLKDEFKTKTNPYLFAKTGSMGNIYCLSGYLKTKSGRVLIFSFMNNNFNAERSSQIKGEMLRIFEILSEYN